MKVIALRKSGFTLVEIMIVVAIIGLLATIAIPNFARARTTAQQNSCIKNLSQIDAAKQQWALETHQNAAATPSYGQLDPYLNHGQLPQFSNGIIRCPASGLTGFANNYNINSVATSPTCKIVPATHVLD